MRPATEPALLPAIESAREALRRYRDDPASTRDAAVAALREVAEAVASKRASKLSAGDWTDLRELLTKTLSSGVFDAGVREPDLGTARGWASAGEQGLFAAMLVAPAWQWGDAPSISAVPPALVGDYVAWLFAVPQGFVQLGQAEAYPRRMVAVMQDLLQFVRANSGSAAMRDGMMSFLRHGNCIPWYFCADSLRSSYEVRAQLLQYVSTGAGPEVTPKPRDGRRLRVGFLNRHFGPQTETYTTLPMFESLDPDRFEVQLFATHSDGSALEAYARRRVSAFTILPEEPRQQLVTLRSADLDVLVFGTNLTAVYHEIARLALHRIAPLQVVNNSSCTTTGFPEIDLYVSGTLTELPDSSGDFSERLGLVAGPAHAFNYDADRQEPNTIWTRAALGIPEDAIVFVSAANYFKIIPEMREVWARLLAAVPGSRLLLHPFNPNWSSSYPIKRFSAELDNALTAHGVATDRLILSAQTLPSRSDVKELLRVGDVYLDTYPFGGVNSLVDPLELGMPVVVWEGGIFRSRMGGALLRTMGLDELIATDEKAYLSLATEIAGNVEWRDQLKKEIADQMGRAPIFLDTLAASDAFGALVETAYDELRVVGRPEFRRKREPVRVPVPGDPMALVRAGVELLECDDTAGAAAKARAVLGADPNNVAARHLLGAVLLRQGHALRAVDYLLGAVQRADRDAPLWHDLAVALHESGRPPQAIQALESSLRIDPKRVDGWLLLVQLAEAAGNTDLRQQALEVVQQLAPERNLQELGAGAPPVSPAADAGVKHILVYTDDPEQGGVAHYNHTLLLALRREGYRVTCVQSKSASPMAQEQCGVGIRHVWLDYDTGREFARTIADTDTPDCIFRAERPDLIVFSDCCPVSNLAARQAAIRLAIPYVIVVGFVGAYLAQNFSAQLPLLAQQYALASEVVAVSQENLDLLHHLFGLPLGKGRVIHNCRPAKFFEPRSEANRARLRKELNLPVHAIICFTAARLTMLKGFDLQVAAIAELRQKPGADRLHFVWAGDGDQRAALEQEITRRGLGSFVHLLGQRWDVPDWYDAADMLVFPSRLEGMPLAVMEAMAKGLPVIATSVSGIPEELGDTGCLLGDPNADPAAVVKGLVIAIQRWADDAAGRQAAGVRGRARADKMFREEVVMRRMLELIETQLAHRQRLDLVECCEQRLQ